MMKKRALTVRDIRSYRPRILPFEGKWLEAIGRPEPVGTWIVWGNSANGKTRFSLQLAKYIANFCRVAYDSLEEGLSLSMQQAVEEVGMYDCVPERNFVLLDREPVRELAVRLGKQRSPRVVIIDSLQYSGLTYAEYRKMRDTFYNRLFIYVSHAEGREPKGNVARSIKYDAFVKIYVEGYRAYAQSRFGGGKEIVIWEKGAREYGNIIR